MNDGFLITKQADGRLRWFGFPTNNAKDRDRETLPANLLANCIDHQKAVGQYPELWFYHIPFPVGGTDYMNTADGVVYATGLINDDPVCLKMAQFAVDHPEGLDGSGWGMSHSFLGVRGPNGVYTKISNIKEFTYLPLSRAANPYTSFALEEVLKMLRKEQQQALDIVLGDPTMLEVVKQHLVAVNKSAALDDAGVQRKEVNAATAFGFTPLDAVEKDTQYMHGAGGALNAPGAGGEAPSSAGAQGDMNKPGAGGGNGETEIGACAECGHDASEHETFATKEHEKATGGACKVVGCKCAGYTKAKKDAADTDSDAGEASKAAAVPAPAAAPEVSADEIAQAIHKMGQDVTGQVETLMSKMLDRLESLESRIQAFETDESVLKEQHEAPRLTLLDRLDNLSASRSQETIVDRRSGIGKGAPDLNKLEKEYDATGAPAVARLFGFGD